MKTTHIVDKLKELDCPVESLALGDFDQIGELTAKKSRRPDNPLYKSAGCFFRPNYERGMLIYALIRKFNVKSYLEIGFGRGYSAVCAAMALDSLGDPNGKVTTVDVNMDQNHLQNVARAFPQQWMSRINFVHGKSQEVLQALDKFDMIYIDGDHTYDGVKRDWELCRDKWNKVMLFDDYHMPTKTQTDIECAKLIDQIEDPTKELIILDRRIFFDDRRMIDDQIDYGQVLMTRSF